MIGVFCKKKPYKRDYILQKRRIILSILLTVATPYPASEWLMEHRCMRRVAYKRGMSQELKKYVTFESVMRQM